VMPVREQMQRTFLCALSAPNPRARPENVNLML
jgi:hypothetical protein